MKKFIYILLLLMAAQSSVYSQNSAQTAQPNPKYLGERSDEQEATLQCRTTTPAWYYNTTHKRFKQCIATNTWSFDWNNGTGGGYTFAVGTSGTDFNVGSSGATRTFNLPSASGTNRGLLTSSDWAIFNNKQAGDADLTAFAALAPTDNDILQRKSGVWTNRSLSQFKTDLAYTFGDFLPSVSGQSGNILSNNGTVLQWITPAGGGAGLTLLNGLNNATQTFAVGTAGTDFAISSSGSAHTFNFPNASGTNRGLLTSADWTIFNNKGTGTVTSVSLAAPSFLSVSGSPVTASGTITLSLAAQSQNLGVVSPNGSTGPPTFRSLAAADIPNLNAAKITTGTFGTSLVADDAITFAKFQNIAAARLLGRSTASNGNVEEISVGSGLALSSGTLSATGGGSTSTISPSLVTTTTNYNITASDHTICVDSLNSAPTINLPAAASVFSAGRGQVFVIKDCNGTAQSNTITVEANGGTELINESYLIVFGKTYQSYTVQSTGVKYIVIAQ